VGYVKLVLEALGRQLVTAPCADERSNAQVMRSVDRSQSSTTRSTAAMRPLELSLRDRVRPHRRHDDDVRMTRDLVVWR
jgi:hypothetical protein